METCLGVCECMAWSDTQRWLTWGRPRWVELMHYLDPQQWEERTSQIAGLQCDILQDLRIWVAVCWDYPAMGLWGSPDLLSQDTTSPWAHFWSYLLQASTLRHWIPLKENVKIPWAVAQGRDRILGSGFYRDWRISHLQSQLRSLEQGL